VIVGVEGIHTWETGLVLNDRLSGYPYYRVERIPGLRSAPDVNPQADPTPGRTGEKPRLTDRLGKTITYEGLVVARNIIDLERAYAELVAAFSGTIEMRMVASPHPDYPGGSGSGDLPPLPTREFYARPLDAGGDEEQTAPAQSTSLGYERPFSLSLRLSDPRFYNPDTKDYTSDVVGAVDMDDALGFPFVPGDSLSPPTADAINVVIHNDGTVDTDPIIRINGPCTNPSVSNRLTNEFLRFRNISVDDGDAIHLDFHERRATLANDDLNVRKRIDPASTWWDRGVVGLVPGEQAIRLRSRTLGDGASLEVLFKEADYA
jgi:hypothetical protein